MPDNVGPITGRAGTEPRSTDRNYTAGPVRCIGGLYRLQVSLAPSVRWNLLELFNETIEKSRLGA